MLYIVKLYAFEQLKKAQLGYNQLVLHALELLKSSTRNKDTIN